MRSRVPTRIRQKLYASRPMRCERCGIDQGLEIHHKIPLSIGGTNDIENLEILCGRCHMEAHRINRSELTKQGIERAREKYEDAKNHPEGYKVKRLVDVMQIYEFVERNNYELTAAEIMEFIGKLKIEKIECQKKK